MNVGFCWSFSVSGPSGHHFWCPGVPQGTTLGAPGTLEMMLSLEENNDFHVFSEFPVLAQTSGKTRCARTAFLPKLPSGPPSRKSRALPRGPRIGKKASRRGSGATREETMFVDEKNTKKALSLTWPQLAPSASHTQKLSSYLEI